MSEVNVATKVLSQPELSLMEERPEPCVLIIFGGMGDLAHRKLYPTLAYLHAQSLLPADYAVVVVARRELSDENLRKAVGDSVVKAGGTIPPGFLERVFFSRGDLTDSEFYARLQTQLTNISKEMRLQGRLFYLATSPTLYPVILRKMADAGLNVQDNLSSWPRVIVEKPFGVDLESAKALNKEIHSIIPEGQVYRIDHYLGKETVQNILILRFANTFFEPAWNRQYVDHVQITVTESIGIENRGPYYDQSGILRDMFQNHLLQLLSLVAMEPPACFQADPISDSKINVLRSIAGMNSQNLILGQYASGPGPNGSVLPGYQNETGVASDSRTPTFASAKLEVDNWRWHGVPFYLRSGKRLPKRISEIAIHFKHVPVSIFKPLLAEELSANILKIRLQPDEGVSLSFETKHPGSKISLSTVTMNFDYYKAFGVAQPEAYARLILDAFIGDRTLFTRNDFVEEAWRILTPVLEAGNKSKLIPVRPYGLTAGDWGPQGVGELLVRDGRTWDRFF